MILERDTIYITKKQASIAVVALSALCLLTFMVGYSWGKQSALNDFGQRITEESVQDGADYESMVNSLTDALSVETLPHAESEDEEPLTTNNSFHAKNVEKADSAQSEKKDVKKYSATLIGFGTKGAAQSFVSRLGKHGITVFIKTRTSKSASGKTKKNWYQIVTNSYNSKEELQSLIAQIQKFERLKSSDIKIN